MCLVSPGELYTHPEVDEEDDDSSSKASADRPVSAIDIKMKNRLSGSFAESGSTSSSLQEFERLESEILRSASHSGTPQKTPHKMSGNASDRPDDLDPAPLSPAQERINILTTQSTLSEIDEGHESQASYSGETVTGGSQEDSDSEAIERQLTEIEELTSRHYRRKELQETRQESADESSSPAIRPQQIDLLKRTSFDRSVPGKQSTASASAAHCQPAGMTSTERKSRDDADKDDEEEGEREDEFDEESYRREESYRISHCMLASADSVELDLMTASFRSEATMISSSEGFDYVLTSEPKLAFAGSSVTQTSRIVESEEHVTSESGQETSHSYSSASNTATQCSTSTVHRVPSDEDP